MRSLKTGCKTFSIAPAVWHVAPSCWNQMLPIFSSSIFVNKCSDNDLHWVQRPLLSDFRRKMSQLCLWSQIRTKQWLILNASAFQCKRAGFLSHKCDNFAYLQTRQDQIELHLKRWLFCHWLQRSLIAHFRGKISQLYLWTKIRTKQWFVMKASAFQCKLAGFLCHKCDNFACLHTRQYQNELHLKRWFFYAKIGIFFKSIAGPLPSVA